RKGNLKNCHFTKDSLLFPTKEAVDELPLHPDFAATLDTVGPQTFPSDLTGYRILYQNIYYNERSVARLLICETEFPFRDSDYTLTAVAVKYIEKAFSHRNDNSFFLHPPQLTRMFQNLISGELMSENDLQNTIQPLGWHINDTFVCFHIVSNMKKAGAFLNTCLSLEKKIRYSIAIPVKDSIFYVVDLTASNLSRRDLMGILIYDFRESLLKAGISSEYTDLAETVFYYRQASIALDYGSVQNPQIWTYYFDDYALDYALNQIETSIPAWCFCNRKLKKLIQYDRENKRSYSRSLQVYMENNMSVAKTIRVLYLQRQTFLYHLKRIEEITGLNLNDYPTRLYLQLSFQLLERSSVDLNGNN
ncbi:MAG: PucR family transcriptional regulator, partial [Lachnospiraceae bacterium]